MRVVRPIALFSLLGVLLLAGAVLAQEPSFSEPPQDQEATGETAPEPMTAPPPTVSPLPPPPRRPTRASAPQQPAARPAPAVRTVAMNFKDAELEAVVKFISELTGKNFILDEKVRGKVTVISPTQLTVDEAYEVFQAILGVKGFTIVPAGKVYKIVFTREAKQSNIETVRDGAPPGDRFVTRILPLKFVAVETISGIIAPLVSKDASVVAYAATNTLIITDAYSNIERLIEIIQALDVETVETVLEIIPVRYASADAISKSLTAAFAAGAPARGRAPARPRVPAGAQVQVQVQAETTTLKIISDARTNSLIVISDPPTMQDIKTMIRALDVEIPKGTGKINVYYLKYADAENVAAVLTAISKSAGTKPRPGQPIVQPGQAPQAAAAARAPAEITLELEEAVQITSDKATNSLVIIATPQDFELLKTIIAKLDIRRPQVLVEALILEMSFDKSLELGVEWRTTNDPSKDGLTVVGGTNFGQIAAAAQNPLALGSGLFLGAIDGTLTYGGMTFLNIGALVRALQGTGDVNVLSTPHLLTTDNEEAEIVVSDNIPFQTSQKFDNNGNPIYTFDYKDVGLTLRFTPQINEEDYVKMKLFQEVSQVISTTTGTTTNAPSTTKRTAKTTVVVKDSSTVVIGGLIKDNTLSNVSSVPCLGNLPLLGYLFRTSSDRTQKTNLLIFLTPHIVRSAEDMKNLTLIKSKEFQRNIESRDLPSGTAPEKLKNYLELTAPEKLKDYQKGTAPEEFKKGQEGTEEKP